VVTVDLRGYPKAPNAVAQIAYDDQAITLSVSPGGANAAYPALEGFTLYRNGAAVARCDTSGDCGVIRTAKNGEKALYEAKAVNSVGESRSAVSVTAWSYDTPGMGELTAEPVFDEGTTTAQGVVTVKIRNDDPSTNRYSVNGTEEAVATPGVGTTEFSRVLPVGEQTITVTPLSKYDQPAGSGPTDLSFNQPVTVAGSPSVAAGTLDSANTSITVSGTSPNKNFSAEAEHILFVASTAPGAVCTLTPAGFTSAGNRTSKDSTIGGLTKHTNYYVTVCYSNGYGEAADSVGPITTWVQPSAPGDGSYTYGMATPASGQSTGQYLITTPTSSATVPADFVVDWANYDETTGSTVFGADPGITVRYCIEDDTAHCSDWSTVTAADTGKAWQVTYGVTTLTTQGCVVSSTIAVAVTATDSGLAKGAVDAAQYDVPGENNTRVWVNGDENVPANAQQTQQIMWTITWTAPGTKDLPSVSGTLAGPMNCVAANAPTT
jgi:hypothetical protein